MANSLYNNYKTEISGYNTSTQIGEMRNICYHLVRSLTQTQIENRWSGILERANNAYMMESNAKSAGIQEKDDKRWKEITDYNADMQANLAHHLKRLDSARKLYKELSGKEFPMPNLTLPTSNQELGKE